MRFSGVLDHFIRGSPQKKRFLVPLSKNFCRGKDSNGGTATIVPQRFLFIGASACDQFVKLALAASPTGHTTPATSSSLSPSSSSPDSSEVLLGTSSPSAAATANVTVSLPQQQPKHSQQQQQQASASTAYFTYSNASTVTGNTLPATSDYPVVYVPVERGGFMARENEEWVPPEILKSQAREERALALERDRLVRSRSVANDTILNLPVSVPMPDGEELYRGATSNSFRNNYDQHSEITKGYIQGPPNKTVWDSPDWRDWDQSAHSKPGSCSPGASQPKSSQSTGQLSSWGLNWRFPSERRSGKSHTRTRQRHSHPSNSKNSSSSSTSSSSSSSTSSCAGLLVNSSNHSNCASNHATVSILSSIGKIQNAFTTAGGGGGGGGSGGENAWTNPNYNSSTSVMSRISNDETKFSPRNSKTNNSGSSQQNLKEEKSHSGLNDITRTQSSSLCVNASTTQLGTKEDMNQSPPPPSSSLLLNSNNHPSNSSSSDLLLSAGGQSSSSSTNNIKIPSLKSTQNRTATTTTTTATIQYHEPSSSPLPPLQGHHGQNQPLLSLRLTKVDGGGKTEGNQTLLLCENVEDEDTNSFSQNLFKRVNERTGPHHQNFECSILNDDDNGNRGGGGGIQPEKCIGDIQCRLENDVQYSSSSSDSTKKNKHESECEPFLS